MPHGRLRARHHLPDAIDVPQGAWAVERRRVLRTILGSCVAVCLFDPVARVGGMNHYVYPPRGRERTIRCGSTSMAGDVCMAGLFEAMLRAGARPERLRAKAFGGGRMFEHEDVMTVGKHNTRYAVFWLEQAGIPLDLSDFHGRCARRLIFHPDTGEHLCERMPAAR
ncbi:MAG: chemotaxis protein CheD [Rhodocyclaceae bacterium]|nr:chemotaxis protein CheD [Rhodocyclaceae bacterium]